MVNKDGLITKEDAMSNMSYCRFENTHRDLGECMEALEEMLAGDSELSARELSYAKRLVERCQAIVLMVAERGEIRIDYLEDNEIETTMDEANKDAILGSH